MNSTSISNALHANPVQNISISSMKGSLISYLTASTIIKMKIWC